MAFDGIVCKAVASELNELSGARIDKILQPNKNNIILGFYLNGKNYALNICIDSGVYRLNLTTHSKKNPKTALNFCMLLRKYLIGLRIKSVSTIDLERVAFIEFEGFDDVDDIVIRKLAIELMGKHSNIILLDDQNLIIDSLRHTKNIDEGFRNIIPHTKYSFPKTDKYSFFKINNFKQFTTVLYENIDNLTIENLALAISNTFNGICKSFINYTIESLEIKDVSDNSLELIYNYINKIITSIGTFNLSFSIYNNKKNDYALKYEKNIDSFCLNFFLDDFYYKKETSEGFKNYRDTILKMILGVFKKYNKRLSNIYEKLKECDNMDMYKLYGELITANLYRIKDINTKSIELENYYDDNKKIIIPLNEKFIPSINAKRFYKKYNKLKNTLEIVTIQKEETLKELNYIESIVYELECSSSIDDVSTIFEEISENIVFKDKISKYSKNKKTKVKKSNLTKNKQVSFNPIKYVIDGYNIFVGRNNKENDYLTLKYANKSDIWFHTKDIHGSHVILKLDTPANTTISDGLLIKCSQIAAYHSKGRLSSNVPVDYCQVKYVKKPSGSKPGMVIYTNNQTLNVMPKIL